MYTPPCHQHTTGFPEKQRGFMKINTVRILQCEREGNFHVSQDPSHPSYLVVPLLASAEPLALPARQASVQALPPTAWHQRQQPRLSKWPRYSAETHSPLHHHFTKPSPLASSLHHSALEAHLGYRLLPGQVWLPNDFPLPKSGAMCRPQPVLPKRHGAMKVRTSPTWTIHPFRTLRLKTSMWTPQKKEALVPDAPQLVQQRQRYSTLL